MSIEYRFQRSANSTGPWIDCVGTFTSSPAHLTGQPAGELLYYRMVVKDSAVGNIETASVPVLVLVGTIPELTAVGGEGEDHIALSWTPDCFTSYDIYRRHPVTGIWSLLDNTANSTYDDFAVSVNLSYCYYVVGQTSTGLDVDPSNVACAMITSVGVFNMKSRATVYQGIQIGIETTPGTAVAATKRLLGMELMPNPKIPVKTVKYNGSKAAVGTQIGQEYTEAPFNGAMDPNLLHYLFSLMFGAATETTAGSSTKIHTWKPSPLTPLTPLTATIEQGSSAGAEKFTFAVLKDLSLKWSAEAADIEGTMFAQEYLRNITMTPSLPEVANKPVNPSAIGVYISTDGSSFTLMDDVMSGEFNMTGLWKPSFHQDPNEPSFDRIVEQLPDFKCQVTVEDGTETDNFMTYLANGAKTWMGIKALGPQIESGQFYTVQLRMPCYVTIPDWGDKDSVFGSTFTFECAHDATYGLVEAVVTNASATL